MKLSSSLQGLFFTVLSMVSISTSTFASDRLIYAGNSLPEGFSVALEFKEADALLIRVSQLHADLVVSLETAVSSEPIKAVNKDDYLMLDEVLLVKKAECAQCFLKVKGHRKHDRFLPYRIEVQPLYRENDEISMRVWEKATQAGIHSFKVNNGSTPFDGDLLISLFDELTNNNRGAQDTEGFRYHALWLADRLRVDDRLKDARLVLKNLKPNTQTTLAGKIRELTLMGILSNNVTVGEEFYKKALVLANKNKNEMLTAMVKNFYAVHLGNNGKYELAEKLFEEIQTALSRVGSYRRLADTLSNLSWVSTERGDTPKSIQYATQLKVAAEQFSHLEDQVWASYLLGKVYGKIGERYVAESHLNRALRVSEEKEVRDDRSMLKLRAYVWQEKAERYTDYGAFELAKDAVGKMQEIVHKMGSLSGIAVADQIEGRVALEMNDFSLAHEKLMSASEAAETTERKIYQAKSLAVLSELALRTGDVLTASEFNEASLRIFSRYDSLEQVTQRLIFSCELLRELGDTSGALELANRIKTRVRSFAKSIDRARFSYISSILNAENGKVEFAFSEIKNSLVDIEKALHNVKHAGIRRSFLALQEKVYSWNIRLIMTHKTNKIEQSLRLLNQYRARTLNEALTRYGIYSQASRAQRNKRRSILKKINLISSQSWDDQKQNIMPGQLQEVRLLAHQLAQVEADVQTSQATRTPPPQESVNTSIAKGEKILHYFLSTHGSWLFILGESTHQVVELPNSNVIERLVKVAFHNTQFKPAARSTHTAVESATANFELTKMLVGPLLRLSKNENIDKLRIVADGLLHNVPFALMKLNENGKILLDKFAISYSHSLEAQRLGNALSVINRKLVKEKATLVGYAPSKIADSHDITMLDYVGSELQSIVKIVPDATILWSDSLLKQELLDKIKQPRKILHLATHGYVNNLQPALSGLLLTKEENSSLLIIPEISGLAIQTDLVVLSACQAADGTHAIGEGLLSLSRAFIRAGASTVVASLWSADDQATAELMKQFYRNLRNSMTIEEALQQAQRSIRNNSQHDWSDPFYWGGFKTFGLGGIVEI